MLLCPPQTHYPTPAMKLSTTARDVLLKEQFSTAMCAGDTHTVPACPRQHWKRILSEETHTPVPVGYT